MFIWESRPNSYQCEHVHLLTMERSSHALGDVFAAQNHSARPLVPLKDAQVLHFIDYGYLHLSTTLDAKSLSVWNWMRGCASEFFPSPSALSSLRLRSPGATAHPSRAVARRRGVRLA